MNSINKLMTKSVSDLSKIFTVDINNLSKFMGSDISASYVFLDEFTGTNGDPPNPTYWTNAPSQVSIQNNELRFESCSAQRIVTSKFTISGSCDVQVDFNDFAHDSYNNNSFVFQLYDGATQEDGFIRVAYTSNANKFSGNIRHNGSWGTTTVVDRNNDYGSVRIVHQGSVVTLYYKDGTGGWTVLKTGTVGDVDFIARLKMERIGASPTGDFDNFTIVNGIMK